jgi:hypothetical protein
MKDRKKILTDLVDKLGLDKASNLTGLSKLDLIRRSDCYIDLSMANDIISELFREKIFPRKYENCQIDYDSFSGVVNWICEWGNETTFSMATPFWDINDGIPVDTESYLVKLQDGSEVEFTEGDLDNQPYKFIKWKDGFENLALYDRWIRRFYLPQVHSVIEQHLQDYRNI